MRILIVFIAAVLLTACGKEDVRFTAGCYTADGTPYAASETGVCEVQNEVQ